MSRNRFAVPSSVVFEQHFTLSNGVRRVYEQESACCTLVGSF